jgi:hypothetical protein
MEAVELRREMGQHRLAIESLAGLVRVSLAEENQSQALAQTEEILDYLEDNTLDGTEEPLRIYLTCYRALLAVGDPHARSILDVAHRSLQEQAVKISDEEMRRWFLENVPYYREIVDEYEDVVR